MACSRGKSPLVHISISLIITKRQRACFAHPSFAAFVVPVHHAFLFSFISVISAMKDRHKGILIALFGVLSISPDAVLVRFLTSGGTDPWTLIFWKLLFSIIISAPYAIYEAGGITPLWRSFVRGKWYYAAAIVVQCTVDIGFTFAFVFSSAAEALLLINLNPLWCALLGRLFLGDKLPMYTIVALVLALVCICIIFVPELIISKRNDDDTQEDNNSALKGDIISLFTGIALAVYISIIRKASAVDINLIGAAALASVVASAISIIVRKGDVLPNNYWRGNGGELWQFWLAIIAEACGAGIVFVSLTIAPRLAKGAEVAVVLLLEVILGPLWVFVAYGDVPSKWTIIGGSLLLVVLALHECRPLFKKAHRGFMSMRSKSQLEASIGSEADDRNEANDSIDEEQAQGDKDESHAVVGNGDEEEEDSCTDLARS